jgi:hypothetical protein
MSQGGRIPQGGDVKWGWGVGGGQVVVLLVSSCKHLC